MNTIRIYALSNLPMTDRIRYNRHDEIDAAADNTEMFRANSKTLGKPNITI